MVMALSLTPGAAERIVKAQIEARKEAPVGAGDDRAVIGAMGAACGELLKIIQDEFSEHLNLIEDALDRLSDLEAKL
jgi:hypothetical protein